jgi:hypothetical protein
MTVMPMVRGITWQVADASWYVHSSSLIPSHSLTPSQDVGMGTRLVSNRNRHRHPRRFPAQSQPPAISRVERLAFKSRRHAF